MEKVPHVAARRPARDRLKGLAKEGGTAIYGRMSTVVKSTVVAAFLLALGMGSAQAQTGTFIDTFGVWNAFSDKENGKPLCYIASLPEKSAGKYSERGDAYVMITLRPGENKTGEVSIRAGYVYKKDTDTLARVDSGKPFKLFTDGGYAWTRDTETDHALIVAMRGGGVMIVEGTSTRGTLTTDTYSLKGFTAAYNAAATACGIK